MIIEKILNNNVILTTNEQGKELVVMGRGLAFQKKVGDAVEEEKIEKTFFMETEELVEGLAKILSEMPLEYLKVTYEILELIEESLQLNLNDTIYLTLTDHISFAISRFKSGIQMKNPLLWEIRKFYPDEYEVGVKSLDIIERRLGIRLDEDEAGFIALHIVGLRLDGQEVKLTVDMTRIVHDILSIVSYHYGVTLDEDSLNYTRFITHIQYLAQRVLRKEVAGSNDEFFFDQVAHKYPEAYTCTQKIQIYLQNTYNANLTKDELVYLIIHIYRVTERNPGSITS
ncbi:BglG family transcription antiterminator LicT [Culicoidibacter larvae]|uniref:PRD domain-containing protein n=1 Tax=Culicoidibacter larvae TaxID=2579976 RepID=A0A5R8QJQ5_9FIRM|nr:PRD domain-containing protein [Culicoidibacter larvae]TLG77497.1 PRD domain-containing protein [Culicoidibacter larvae]